MATTFPGRGAEAGPAAVPQIPFRGIRPFRYADHAIFFAREEETRHLLRLVVVYRGALLYGASGAGKSSLINAGLMPAARAHGYLPERIRVQARAEEELVVERLEDGLPDAVLSLSDFRARLRRRPASERPLLIFDQLEELITLFDTVSLGRVQQGIAELLVELLQDEVLSVKVLLVFRQDYLAQLKQVLAARPELIDQGLLLSSPASDSLPTIIRGPFERHPGHFAHELSPDVAARVCVALAERFGTGEVSLSEVQTVCLRLWQSRDPGALLDSAGIQGILEGYLGEELDAFPPELKYPAVALLARMVTASGTRNVISADDLIARVRENDDIAPSTLRAALGRLEGESKLVGRERRRDLELYEITSEFLVPWISRRREELVRQYERRRERRRLFVGGAVMATLLAGAALIFFLLALAARNEEERRDRARSQALGPAAVSQLETDPAVALQTALQAYDTADTPEARAAVRAVLAQSRLQRILRDSPAAAVAYSGDGRRLVTVSFEGAVSVWDPRTGSHVAVMRGVGLADLLAVDRTGGLIAVGYNDGSARVWNLTTRRSVIVRHRAGILDDVALSPDGNVLATAGQDRAARLWDPRTGRQRAVLRHRDIFVYTVAFSSDGALLVSSSSDKTARVWRVRDGRLVATLRHRAEVDDAEFSPDDRRIVTADSAGIARVWDLASGQARPLRGHVGPIARAAFSPDGRTVATAGADGTARLWNAATGRSFALLAGHGDDVDDVDFNPGGDVLLTAAADGTARLWSVPGAKPLGVFRGQVGNVSAAFSPAGRQVVTTNGEHTRLWRASGTEQPAAVLGGEPAVVSVSRNGKWLARVFWGGAVRVGPVDDWDGGVRLPPEDENAEPVAEFSSDGELLVTSDRSGAARLWRAPDWRSAGVLKPRGTLEGAGFRRDGRVLATVADGVAQLWSTASLRPLRGAAVRLRDTTDYGAPSWPSFSRGGRLILFSGGAAQLWDPRRRSTSPLSVDGVAANPAALSDGGDVLIGSGNDRTAIWRLRGTRLQRLADHAGEQSALSPDGRFAVTAAGTRATEIWATRSGRRIRTLPTPDAAEWATFSPSGRFVATSAYGGTVRLWDAATGTGIASLAGSHETETSTTATIAPGDTHIFVAADRLRVYRCDACGPFPQVLQLARRQAATLR